MTLMDVAIAPTEGGARLPAHIFCLQLGSKTSRTVNDDDAEKGHAYYDTFAMADLSALAVKELEVTEEKPLNGKRLRVEHTANALAKVPKAVLTNSAQERQALKHLDGIHASFTELYRHRRPLYTHPKNECEVPKFVCTTVCTPCSCPLSRSPARALQAHICDAASASMVHCRAYMIAVDARGATRTTP